MHGVAINRERGYKFMQTKIIELTPIYDSRQSFYGKAILIIEDGKIKLLSYNTIVAEVEGMNFKIFGFHSATTLRHIKEFYRQYYINTEVSKKDLEKYLEPKK